MYDRHDVDCVQYLLGVACMDIKHLDALVYLDALAR